jgi:outer membrane protein insertion porin family
MLCREHGRLILALVLCLSGTRGAPGAAAQKKAASPKPAAAPKPAAPKAEADRWPVAVIRIEGNRLYRSDLVTAAAGLRIGQLAGKQEFDAAHDRLLATGLFETVSYRFAPAPDGKGFAATFQVVEVEPVYPVRFERLPASDADLTAALRARDPLFSERIPATDVILKRHARVIEAFLASRNQRMDVVGKVVAPEPEKLSVVFRPAAPLPAVAQVKFQGNQVLPSATLLNAFSGVAYGVAYTEPSFRQLLDSQLRPLYDARGRVAATFPKITVEKASGVEGVVVTVVVDEGPSYNLGSVKVSGNSALKSRDLIDVAKIQTGDIANFDDVAAGAVRIRDFYRRQGYMKADTHVDRALNPKLRTVDALIRVEEGPRFVFGKLNVEGLDIHGEAAIRKLWSIKEGKPFNAEYPEYFLNRVREDSLFDGLGKTKSSIKVDDVSHVVDVTLTFGAAPPPERKKRNDWD